MNTNSQSNHEIFSLIDKIKHEPNNSQHFYDLGLKYKSLGDFKKAAIYLEKAVALKPDSELFNLYYGTCKLELKDYPDAIKAFVSALKINPSRADTYNILGIALIDVGLTYESTLQFMQALKLDPNHAAAYDNLGRANLSLGRQNNSVQAHYKSYQLSGNKLTYSNYLYALNCLEAIDEKTLSHLHRKTYLEESKVSHSLDHATHKPVKLGFVSGDFLNHAVSYFFIPLIENIDKNTFKVFCFSANSSIDETTLKIKKLVDEYHDISSRDDQTAAAFIRSKKIDILIDLSGHTGHNRLGIFALRAAKKQVTWLGYPNTTGLSEIDYRITDAATDPEEVNDVNYSEKLIRLPKCFLTYQPFKNAPPVVNTPALKNNYITFGSFNNIAKVNPQLVKVWSKILSAIPNSRLLIHSKGLHHHNNSAYILKLFTDNAITPDRISFSGEILSREDHFKKYSLVDIGLDTFPYNGTTTTCECLWMGIPVITFCGKPHRSRVGASLLGQLNHPDWITHSIPDYINQVIRLASDITHINSIRKNLRLEMNNSALCDSKDFALRFEHALNTILST